MKRSGRNTVVQSVFTKYALRSRLAGFIEDVGNHRVVNPDTGRDVRIKSLGKTPAQKALRRHLYEKWLELKGENEEPTRDELIAALAKAAKILKAVIDHTYEAQN